MTGIITVQPLPFPLHVTVNNFSLDRGAIRDDGSAGARGQVLPGIFLEGRVNEGRCLVGNDKRRARVIKAKRSAGSEKRLGRVIEARGSVRNEKRLGRVIEARCSVGKEKSMGFDPGRFV